MRLPAGLALRPLANADVPAVAALVASVMPYAWSQATFASCFGADYLSWVVVHEAGIAAVLVAKRQLDSCELLNLAVAHDFQHQGIGSALVQNLCNTLSDQGITNVWLEVRQSNQAAQALYHRLGFTVVAMRPGYYPSADGRETAVVMQHCGRVLL